ncbi:putative glycosyl transferase, family 14, beta-glucuronosyltransferase GlcAT14A/B/C [Dioscorea sansibarensis]
MASAFLCLSLTVTTFNISHFSSIHTVNTITSIFTNQTITISINHGFSSPPTPPTNISIVPRLAYLVSGSKGELDQLWGTLRALYHPRNWCIIRLNLKSPVEERLELSSNVTNDPNFAKVGDVHVISKANMVTYRGPKMVANTLHACAILLKMSKEWDWFINLNMSYTFSSFPRSLNFVEHTRKLEWKEFCMDDVVKRIHRVLYIGLG